MADPEVKDIEVKETEVKETEVEKTDEQKPDPISFINYWRQYSEKNKPVGFEGPEKRLEVIIRSSDDLGLGFRGAPRETWDAVVGSLNAKIVSHTGNDSIDSYVLTESSLFVMPNRVVLLTCGTTTLLNALPKVMEIVKKMQFEVEWASFMRKNFTYPLEQKGPHTTVESEIAGFTEVFSKGQAFIFGPADSDHYFLCVFDDIIRPAAVENDCQMSMTMYDMDHEVAEVWYADQFYPAGPETAKRRAKTGLDILFPSEWVVQDLQFEPCGYSVNSITNDGQYQTIHITPEDFCSFASYETNSPMTHLAERMEKVLSVFRPQRFTVACLLDPHSGVGLAWKEGKAIGIEPESFPNYELKTRMINEFGHGYALTVFNYVMKKKSEVE